MVNSGKTVQIPRVLLKVNVVRNLVEQGKSHVQKKSDENNNPALDSMLELLRSIKNDQGTIVNCMNLLEGHLQNLEDVDYENYQYDFEPETSSGVPNALVHGASGNAMLRNKVLVLVICLAYVYWGFNSCRFVCIYVFQVFIYIYLIFICP